MSARICIIDYQRGNLASVQRGLADAGFEAWISSDPQDIYNADGLVLPGVGSFADAMGFLEASGQAQAIRHEAASGKPLLGICLGLQLLFESGDEGSKDGIPIAGLGLIPGTVQRMPAQNDAGQTLKVPHVGWNSVEVAPAAANCPLFAGIDSGSYFYFTHSYVGVPADSAQDFVAATTIHAQPFLSAIWKDNLFATQFHPEKSSKLGMAMLANFGRFVQAHA